MRQISLCCRANIKLGNSNIPRFVCLNCGRPIGYPIWYKYFYKIKKTLWKK